jgi:predicted DNA-binding transcriptional regulator AlpA
MEDSPNYITIKEACALIGGSKPISHATFYRGVKAGRYPKPEHVSPNVVRVRRAVLIAALNGERKP